MCVYAFALVMCRVSDVLLISVMSETSSSLRCGPYTEVSKICVPEQGHVGRVFPNFPVMFFGLRDDCSFSGRPILDTFHFVSDCHFHAVLKGARRQSRFGACAFRRFHFGNVKFLHVFKAFLSFPVHQILCLCCHGMFNELAIPKKARFTCTSTAC